MTPADMEPVLRNLDLRLTQVEQILPTLATKADLREAVRGLVTQDHFDAVVRGLVTQDYFDAVVRGLVTEERFNTVVRGLATKEDVADARRHAQVLYEDLKGDIRLIAEHLARVLQRLDERR